MSDVDVPTEASAKVAMTDVSRPRGPITLHRGDRLLGEVIPLPERSRHSRDPHSVISGVLATVPDFAEPCGIGQTGLPDGRLLEVPLPETPTGGKLTPLRRIEADDPAFVCKGEALTLRDADGQRIRVDHLWLQNDERFFDNPAVQAFLEERGVGRSEWIVSAFGR